MSFVDDLNNLDPSNPGLWPWPIKITVFVIAFVVVLAAAWYFDTSKQRIFIVDIEAKQDEHIQTLERKQKKVANIDVLREQLEEMNQSFGDMLRQLPDKTEVASLLIDLSQKGLATGLEFKLFKPKTEKKEEFYITLPIEISVTGTYHQFGEFISGIAGLPRIVTAHNITIKPVGDEAGLTMSLVAQTYRAEGDEEGEGE